MIKMIELFERLNTRAEKIVNMMVADVVDDIDLLTVALCAGNLIEIIRTMRVTDLDEGKKEAVRKAYELGTHPIMLNAAASNGFFAEGLHGLLDLAEKDSDTGSRLMPIFNELVSNCKKYGIPKKIKVRVKNYMIEKKNRDGFASTLYDDATGRIDIHAADWVNEALFSEED